MSSVVYVSFGVSFVGMLLLGSIFHSFADWANDFRLTMRTHKPKTEEEKKWFQIAHRCARYDDVTIDIKIASRLVNKIPKRTKNRKQNKILAKHKIKERK